MQVGPAGGPGPVGQARAAAPVGQARTDPGFFRKLMGSLNVLRQPTRTAMVMSGIGAAALALDVAATANIGNPFLFANRRDTWKEISGRLESGRADLWRAFFDEVSPNWQGEAKQALQTHLRFNTNGLFGVLTKVSDDMSTTMQGQYKEVLEYDLSVFAIYAASAPIFKTLTALSTTNPVARGALMAYVATFAGGLGNLVKQFADVYNGYETELNKLELKLNDLRAAFWTGGAPDRGPRRLGLPPGVTDPGNINDDYWKRAPHHR
ncbi:hypothetical protein HS048_32375 [Planomonospora sp. ID91781]|uniref:hypothetical protein n=1 Tax=Planomonospora sp. ID91781 TaxID=2738135 RepID=UPI0018C3E217|nr:hypothetical protein [Planomonospora sp. ID91781]MBG0825387.1 hypothetical protein [Planomonospora sp. ID91781]